MYSANVAKNPDISNKYGTPYQRSAETCLWRCSEMLAQGACQLVGTRSAFAVTIDTLQTGDCLFDAHAAYQRSDALRVAVATADELHAFDATVVGGNDYLARTGAVRGVVCDARHYFFSCAAAAELSATTIFLSTRSVTLLSTSISSEVSLISFTVP